MFRKLSVGLVIFLGIGTFLMVLTPVKAQGTSVPTPTATIDPAVVQLQQQVQSLSTQVANAEQQLDLKKETLQLEATKQMLPYQSWATVIAILATVFGISSPLVVYRYLSQQFQKRLDEAIYRADPTYHPIHIPAVDFEKEEKRLQALGFKNLMPYASLTDRQLSGIVVYAAKDLPDVKNLAKFVKDKKADAAKVAFVIYASGFIQGGIEAMEPFDGFSFANHPVTIASQIYALVRGMKQ